MSPGEDTKFQDEEEEEYGCAIGRRDADPHLQVCLYYFMHILVAQ